MVGRRYLVVAACLLAAACGERACAAVQAGQTEVAAAGTFIADVAGSSQTIYSVDAGVHRLLTDGLSGGVRLSAAGINDYMRTIDVWLSLDVYTMGSAVSVPYFGAGIGRSMWKQGGSDGADTLAELHLGFKTFIRDEVAVSVESRYETDSDHFDKGILGVYAGFSVFF